MPDIPDYLARFLAVTAKLAPREVAAIIGVTSTYVSQLRSGQKKVRSMAPERRDRIMAYLDGRVEPRAPFVQATGPIAVREHANGYTVTLGEAALIAVGRFGAIEQMATELARIARASANDLGAANAAAALADEAVAAQDAMQASRARQQPAGQSSSGRSTRRRRSAGE